MEKNELIRLIPRCQTGDAQAQEALVLAVQNRVFYHCKKMLKNEDDALDATQEVLISMLTKLDTWRDAFWDAQDKSFQMAQSLIAIGSGGLLGLAECYDCQLLPQRPQPGPSGGTDSRGRGGQQPT